jgi:mannose-6-phosphate isomerase-like protein (cupin superfamily)
VRTGVRIAGRLQSAPVLTYARFAASLALFLATADQSSGVPVSEEPRQKVVFANEYVRVIDAALPVGDTTLFHRHDRDNVPVVITGATTRTRVIAGATSETTLVTGGVWFAKAAYTHQTANIGTTPLRFIDAEILARWLHSDGDGDRAPIAGEMLVLENDQVRISRVSLRPGESVTAHAHTSPLLHVEVSGGSISGTARAPGAFAWLDARSSHSIENTGDRSYDAVIIEWK